MYHPFTFFKKNLKNALSSSSLASLRRHSSCPIALLLFLIPTLQVDYILLPHSTEYAPWNLPCMTREENLLFSSVNSPILPSLMYSVRPNKHVYVRVIYLIYSVSNLKSNRQ